MAMSQREAARRWAIPRATVQRAIAAGKLSLTGDKKIDPAEMSRFFGPPRSTSEPARSSQMRPDGPPDAALENARLRAENEALRALVQRADAERDRALDTVQRLLTHDGAQRRRWWPFGRRGG